VTETPKPAAESWRRSSQPHQVTSARDDGSAVAREAPATTAARWRGKRQRRATVESRRTEGPTSETIRGPTSETIRGPTSETIRGPTSETMGTVTSGR